ncbi:glycosyltransferase [Bacillus sp. SD088]|uniref:glycosyltransferase n=1 Tax=Bacillus sp. SD088 TaxID=2782012 RepID=UPI001A95D754|nr:glycosyltransferase [Bacillus sp. SD088]MBO0992530.1 glycosyltransferase [Bacillus sp. SD088]
MNKKLCVVTTTSITVRSFLISQLMFLSRNGYHITVICDPDSNLAKELPKCIQYRPVAMNRGFEGIGMIKSIWHLYKIFKVEKYDIVQYSTPNAAFYSSIAARMANIPVRLYCQWGIRYVGYQGWMRQLLKRIEKVICQFSTEIEPDSHGNLLFGRKEGLYSSTKSRVIWNGSANGVDTRRFDIHQKEVWKAEIRERYGILENDFVYGFIGRINKDKGINELLHAFKKMDEKANNVKLLIAGPDDQINSIEADIYEWSKQCKNVIYCGYIHEIEKYYAAMDVFILPSYREGFGSVVIEAEIMGVPVIVTNIPGPTNAMKQDVTGLVVTKGKIKPLQEAMEKLFFDQKLCDEMGRNAHLFSRNHFNQTSLWHYILLDRDKLTNRRRNIRNAQ